MFRHLKTLPLTIVLTVLIWMYAEAQFTSTRDGVRLSVRINSPSPDRTIRLLDANGSPAGTTANLTVTVQGPKNQLDRIYQQSLTQGAGGTAEDEEFDTLSFTPQLESLGNLQSSGGIDSVAMLNSLPYFRKRSVIVTEAVPARLRVEVDDVAHIVRPVEFRALVALKSFSLSPDQVTVNVPSRMLQQIGPENFAVTAVVQGGGRDLATLPPETDQTLGVRYSVSYPGARDERVTVTPAQGSVTVRLPQRQGVTRSIADLPVWVSGSPEEVARYNVEFRPRFIRVVVSGSPGAIEALTARLSASSPPNPSASRVHAYVDISAADRPTGEFSPRPLRFTLPEGLSITEAPTTVDFRLTEKGGAATGPGR